MRPDGGPGLRQHGGLLPRDEVEVDGGPQANALLARLGMSPLLDLGMRLGEASGATLALTLLKAAAACHADMATFAEAGVSGPA